MASDANPGKSIERTVDGVAYHRIPLRTDLVGPEDDIVDVVLRFAGDQVRAGDVLFVTEKIVAITQGRSYPVADIRARPLATFLASKVVKTSYGIGLGMPETMEMALRECGTPRILLAAAAGALGKALGRSGDFYRVAGSKARGIDGPTSGTIPPYNTQVVLTPSKPRLVAERLKGRLAAGVDVAIVDINDIGGNILGSTLDATGDRRLVAVLADNPLGQGHQSTPLGIIRRA